MYDFHNKYIVTGASKPTGTDAFCVIGNVEGS